MRNKKGMSPLIATVLLIAFAVALGAMIMNWSTDVEEPDKGPVTQSTPCSDVSIELNEVFGKKIFCYQDESIRFNIVNTGSDAISGIQLRSVDPELKVVETNIPGSSLAVGATFDHAFVYDKSGKVHVEIVPFVNAANGPAYCVKKSIVQDILPDCDLE